MGKGKKKQQQNEVGEETEAAHALICKKPDYYLGEFDGGSRLFSPVSCRNCNKERENRYFKGTIHRVVAQDCNSFTPI